MADRTGWFVGREDGPNVGNGDVDGAHCHSENSIVEQAVTGPQHHRERHEAEPIDELVSQQRLEQIAAAPDLQSPLGRHSIPDRYAPADLLVRAR